MPDRNRTEPAPTPLDVATLRQWLGDGGEIAFIDLREEGQHGAGSVRLRSGMAAPPSGGR